MSEFVIFPEMLEAGIEALNESMERELRDDQIVITVYLAMQGILEMKTLRGESESVH